MVNVIWDEGFKKIYKKKIKNNEPLRNRFWKMMELFIENPFHPQLRTHKLSGELSGMWAFSVSYDCRVVFKFIDKKGILLIDVGGHDEVY